MTKPPSIITASTVPTGTAVKVTAAALVVVLMAMLPAPPTYKARAFTGAVSLGVANKFLEPYAGAVLAKITILVLIILFIQRRPRGLFALKGRAVEQ